MNDHRESQRQMRHLAFKWMGWWYAALCIYLGRVVWAMWDAAGWWGATPTALVLGALLVVMFRLGLLWRKVMALWDEEDQRAAQARRDEQTILRDRARITEERERAKANAARSDLEALQKELGQ